MDKEPFSNPLAPPSAFNHKADDSSDRNHPLTNDDFRKLMMTPRTVSHGSQLSVPGSVRGSIRSKHHQVYKQKTEASENQKKKKKLYETLRKQEDEVLNELAKKYRDRAKERRDGSNAEYGNGSDMLPNTAYHAVGPGNFDMDAAERRKQLIQESKYLGGDMEHTHLVKGLDYALLQKVKVEIQTKEDEERYRKFKEDEEVKKEEEQKKKSQSGLAKIADISFDDQDRYAVKSKSAEKILQVLFNTKLPERNELFVQGRMAYQYDLVDEFPESYIPTTIIRSKAECPSLDAYNNISTNEIIISKLVQIWSYIRSGGAKKTKKVKPEIQSNVEKSEKPNTADDNIYEDVGDYVPTIKSKNEKRKSSSKKESYFDKKQESEEQDPRSSSQKALELASSVIGTVAATTDLPKTKKPRIVEPESYAECYPGAPENDDAILDSDDEADYSKMDVGSKKNFVNRWDFDSVEEYGDYMSNKEAMPKAAFQYGLKTSDGRLTRRGTSKKDEKAKLDRDLQKINALIAKRKQAANDSHFKD